MEIKITEIKSMKSMEPVSCSRRIGDIPVGGLTLYMALRKKILSVIKNQDVDKEKFLKINTNFWISDKLLLSLLHLNRNVAILDATSNPIIQVKLSQKSKGIDEILDLDKESFTVQYPWDLLKVNSEIVGSLKKDKILGTVRNGATIDGNVSIGKGTVLLPGVYIEGNVIIGNNCKIGPNCYIRGNTYIANNCHIGQSVEIKNSIIMNDSSIGHLSYIGDSVICPYVNLGAGTISANLRHDGKPHYSEVNDKLVNTKRRKLGVIIGDNVHTGINTSFYPGRKMWANTSTTPGEIVNKDIKE